MIKAGHLMKLGHISNSRRNWKIDPVVTMNYNNEVHKCLLNNNIDRQIVYKAGFKFFPNSTMVVVIKRATVSLNYLSNHYIVLIGMKLYIVDKFNLKRL